MTAIDLGPLGSPPQPQRPAPADEPPRAAAQSQGSHPDAGDSPTGPRDRGALDGRLAGAGRGARAQGRALNGHGGGGTGGAGGAAGDRPPARATPGQLQISVVDPVKKAEAGLIPGMSGGYVLYRVDSRSRLPTCSRERNSARRRFRDFVVRAPHVPGL